MTAVVVSSGQLTAVQSPWWPTRTRGSVRMYNDFSFDYGTLYRTQPNVRTCVDFLARNIAQLGLHVFRRVSETDRQRLRDHPLTLTLNQPLPPTYKMTRYRLIEALVSDLGVYFNAYWLKLRQGNNQIGLLRLPPQFVTPAGGLVPSEYKLIVGGTERTIAPDEIVHVRGYNPENPVAGLSPLETLRRVLAEEYAAGQYRESFWQNSARMNGVILRPADAPNWSQTARATFRTEFEELYSGDENSGRTAILEEGMTWQSTSFNPQESEYLAGRKLTREECARAYHIPLPMVGILDHATFSNIREQHKNLYQDALGPTLAMIEQDIELQLLPEFADVAGVYVEFNIAEKLAGSFDEQSQALQSAVGRPWMTANEARAKQNLPSLGGDADVLVTPLNVLIGGQASPRDSAPGKGKELGVRSEGDGAETELTKKNDGVETKALDVQNAELRERYEGKFREAFIRHYRRQESSLAGSLPKRGVLDYDPAQAADGKSYIGDTWYDDARWNRELAVDLLPLNLLTAKTWGELVIGAMEADVDGEAFVDGMMEYITTHSEVQAEYINEYTLAQLRDALNAEDPKLAFRDMFVAAVSVWAARQALSAVTAMLNFGATEGARASGLRRKTWQVNSSNPRPDHQSMNGETVGIRETFSNGLRWPGDSRGTAEDNANCMCSVRFA